MKISLGPVGATRPNWGLQEGSVVSFVNNDGGGHPEVLGAQCLCGAAFSGLRVVILLPLDRHQDPVLAAVVALLGGGNSRSAAEILTHLPLLIHNWKSGRESVPKADLVYAPGLSASELRRLREMNPSAPILVGDTEFDDTSAIGPPEIIRVGGDALVIDSEGIEVPVVFDPSGPVYRSA